MAKLDPARREAFRILVRIERDEAYANLALASLKLKERDTKLICALVYGVCERQISLDYLLEQSLDKPLKKLRPEVLAVLRLGAFQLLFMDSIPPSAAVDTSVQLLKESQHSYAAGLVNAVLRSLVGKTPQYPNKSIQYSVPEWLTELWDAAYGAEICEELLKQSFVQRDRYIRVNTTRTSCRELISTLKEEKIPASISDDVSNAIVIPKGVAAQKTKAFAQGLYHIQGLASQYCAALLDAKKDERVLDMCAAPGGKSFTIAQSAGEVLALELHENRVRLIEEGKTRLGLLNLTVKTADSSKIKPNEIGLFDAVLCDAPCSGLGTLAKKPDIRKKSRSSLDFLSEIQYTLLLNAAHLARDGGRIIYSVCTLNPAEGEEICKRFLECRQDFSQASPFKTLFPHLHGCDGFFIASFRKG